MSTSTRSTAFAPSAVRLTRLAALVVGAVFLVVGILGFIPGITTHYSDMTFAGHMSHAKLLGIFEVSVLHNLVHVAYGVVGLAVAARPKAAVTYFLAGGVVYLALWIYGLAIGHDSSANFVPLNTADNWLHLVLGVAMVGLGLVLQRKLRGSLTADRAM
ncbi:DUF4383 domain-containing protein [Nocardioides sp. URHA0020]|uniref:DUF4383 domain-containing protein n=1 Tax=Nocardioides sp. URHA0020 TaxID=1380392 RepID=UPI00048EE6D2|nr:DUF4383 domain-containing protein [Nocardioides sp. URHA0020]